MKPGDADFFTVTVRDSTGALVNSTVTAVIHLPDNTIVPLTVTNPSLGVYKSLDYVFTLPGQHIVRFTGTGTYPFVSNELRIFIEPLAF